MDATQWAPSIRADKTALPSTAAMNTAGVSFSHASTAYLRSSMVTNSAGLAAALETSTRAVEEQHSTAAEASAVSDLLTRGCRTRSLNATLVDSEMRRMASAEAALAVDAVDDPATMRKLILRSWQAVEFTAEGSLGIQFVAAAEEEPLTIGTITPTGLAAKLATVIVPGMTLEAIQPRGMPQPLPVVGRLGFTEIIRRLSQPNTRPLRMWFSLPASQPNPRGDPLPVARSVGQPFKVSARSAEDSSGAMVPQWSVAPLLSQQWAVLRETPVYSWEQANTTGAASALEPEPEPEPKPESEPPEIGEGVPGLPRCVIGTLSPGHVVTVSEISVLSTSEGDLGQSREIVMARHLSQVAGVPLQGWSVVEGGIQAGGSKNLNPLKQGLKIGEPIEFDSEGNMLLEHAWLNHDHHAQYSAQARVDAVKSQPVDAVSAQTAVGARYACDVHLMTATNAETGLTGVLLRQMVPSQTEHGSMRAKDEDAVDALAWEVRVPDTGCFPSDRVQLLRVKCAGIASAGTPTAGHGESIVADARLGSALLDVRCSRSSVGQDGSDELLVEMRRIAGTAATFGRKECWTAPAVLNLVAGEPFLADGPLKQLAATASAGETAVLLKRGGNVPFVAKARRAAGIGAAAVIIVNTEEQHFVIEGHTYNDSEHTERQTDSGEGLESLPVICIPLGPGEALETLLRDGGQATLQELRYTHDPEERAVLVPPGCQPWQKLRFHQQVWRPGHTH